MIPPRPGRLSRAFATLPRRLGDGKGQSSFGKQILNLRHRSEDGGDDWSRSQDQTGEKATGSRILDLCSLPV
jgi:hypothetical protein